MDREIATAAKWWADQLPEPKASLAEQAGAGPSDAMADPMAEGLYGVLAEKEAATVTPEKVDAFRAALEEVLRANLVDYKGDPWLDKYDGMGFGTDYGPGLELGEALERAGLNSRSMTLLPMKSMMWMGSRGVRVSAGYRGEIVDVPLLEKV